MSRTCVPTTPAAPTAPVHGAPETLRTLRVLWRREVIRFGRNRLRIAMGLVTPCLFLLVLGTGLNTALGASGAQVSNFRAYLFPGVLLMSVQAPSMAVGASLVWDREAGFLRQMLVAPVRRSAVLAGTCLGGATSGALYSVFVLALAGVVGVPYRAELLLAVLHLTVIAFAFTVLGVLAAVCIRRPDTFQVAVSLFMGPLLFLSGAMIPSSGLPGWLGLAVLANPVTYGVDAIRRTLPGDLDLGGRVQGPEIAGWPPPVAVEMGAILLLALLGLALATRRFSRDP